MRAALEARYVAFPPTATYQAPTLRPLSPQSQGSGPHPLSKSRLMQAREAPVALATGALHWRERACYLPTLVVVFAPVVVLVVEVRAPVFRSSRPPRLMPTVDSS